MEISHTFTTAAQPALKRHDAADGDAGASAIAWP